MARGDIRTVENVNDNFTTEFIVDSGTTKQAEAGEPTKADDAAAADPWTGEVGIMVDGDGTTSQRFTGICKDDSTETTSAAGVVVTYDPLPGLRYKAKALTSTTADTAAEVNALRGKRVVFDLTADAWTVDAAATDAVANCVVITGGEYQTNSLYFTYAFKGTWLGFAISA